MNIKNIDARKHFVLGIMALAIIFGSCEKELIDYEGKEGIYFAVQNGKGGIGSVTWPYQPYSKVHLARTTAADSTIRLKVNVTGPRRNYDRPFTVEINPDSTTAEVNTHFKPLHGNLVVPANSDVAYVSLTVLRTPDLKLSAKRIGLRLLGTDQLELSFPEWDAIPGLINSPDPIVQKFDASLHTVIIDDILVKPALWQGTVLASGLESGVWGEFTPKKIEMMCQFMNITYADFETAETMPTVLIQLIRREFGAYLIAQFAAGDPVLEEDGRLMYVQGVSWQSYVGVPWKK